MVTAFTGQTVSFRPPSATCPGSRSKRAASRASPPQRGAQGSSGSCRGLQGTGQEVGSWAARRPHLAGAGEPPLCPSSPLLPAEPKVPHSPETSSPPPRLLGTVPRLGHHGQSHCQFCPPSTQHVLTVRTASGRDGPGQARDTWALLGALNRGPAVVQGRGSGAALRDPSLPKMHLTSRSGGPADTLPGPGPLG